MAWLVLFASGLLETAWAVALKQSDGFPKPGWTVAFAITAAASLAGLAYALKSLPVGSAYAVWTGIGAAGTAILGILFLGESGGLFRVLSLSLIVAGVIGLRVSSTG